MQNNSYIAVLSAENYFYLQGILALSKSLERTNAKYPLTVLITNDVSEKIEKILNSNNIKTIRRNKISIPESIKAKNDKGMFSHWTNTFDKLLIFELTEFDKLVYLDSDMYIRKNIDELFDCEDMSATIDRRSGPNIAEEWMQLTSGLMVIEPKKNILSDFINIIMNIENKRENIGDQDVLQEYDKEWGKKKKLHLDVKYNMFFPHIDYYTHYRNYKLEDIKVIHFIYTKKPFHLKKEELEEYMNFIDNIKNSNYEKYKSEVLKNYIKCGSKDEELILQEYFNILENVRAKLQNK